MEPKKNLPKLQMRSLPLQKDTVTDSQRTMTRQKVYLHRRVYSSRYRQRGSLIRGHAAQTGSLALQCLACSMIFLLVLALQKLNVPVGEGILEGLQFVVSENSELSNMAPETLGEWMEGAMTVFYDNSASIVNQPAAGEGAKDERGWTIYREAGEIRAIMDGVVFYRGEYEDGTEYVRLRHSGGFESWYEGVALTVKVGEELRAGDILGRVNQNETLAFCLKQDGIIVDHTDFSSGS